MTKQEAIVKYSELQEEINSLCKKIEPIEEKIEQLRQKQHSILIENQLYHPMEELKEYDGKDLSSITIYYRRDNSETVEEMFLCGDALRVENGRLYYSDFYNGIIEYSEKAQAYIYFYWHFDQKYDILGFDDLELEESDEE